MKDDIKKLIETLSEDEKKELMDTLTNGETKSERLSALIYPSINSILTFLSEYTSENKSKEQKRTKNQIVNILLGYGIQTLIFKVDETMPDFGMFRNIIAKEVDFKNTVLENMESQFDSLVLAATPEIRY